MQNKLVVAIALGAGLCGSLLTRYIAPPPVFAQTPAAPAATIADEIRARNFVLVNQSGSPAGTFTVEEGMTFNPHDGNPWAMASQSSIVLRNPQGAVVWRAGGSVVRPLISR
jgi:hypothetical protein